MDRGFRHRGRDDRSLAHSIRAASEIEPVPGATKSRHVAAMSSVWGRCSRWVAESSPHRRSDEAEQHVAERRGQHRHLLDRGEGSRC